MTGPDRCPVCNAALSFADEDREPRCHNGHVVPDALMLALERLPRALVKVLAGLVLVGLGKPKEEHSNGFVDARVIADETGFHIDTIGRWAREGRIRSHPVVNGGRPRRQYVLSEVLADLYGRGDANE